MLTTQIPTRVRDALIRRATARAIWRQREDLLDDGQLHVVLCGTGSPVADAKRAGACTAILAGGHFVLVDTGPGSSRNISLWGLPRSRLDAVLFTHFHSDHIGDLGDVVMESWVAGRVAPLQVFGPPGVEQVVEGFRQAYALDTGYRIAHHGLDALPVSGSELVARAIPVPEGGDSAVVFEADGLRIVAFAVDHAPVDPAYGYRVDYRGRSVVISGDTRKNANLVLHATDADVLVSEGLAANIMGLVHQFALDQVSERWAGLIADTLTYHTTPEEAAEEAREAKVRMLVFTHIVPPLPNYLARRLFLRGVSGAFEGRTVLGQDGMAFHLAPFADTITVGSMA